MTSGLTAAAAARAACPVSAWCRENSSAIERGVQEAPDGRFIIDNQYARQIGVSHSACHSFSSLSFQRQSDGDPQPAARPVFGPDRAAVGLDNPLADGEPQAGPAGPFRDRDPVELVEDPFQVLFGEPGPRSATSMTSQGASVRAMISMGCRGANISGIIQQIDQHLGHQHHIHGDQRHLGSILTAISGC